LILVRVNFTYWLLSDPAPSFVHTEVGQYLIVDGEHSWRAAKEVGFEAIECELVDVDDFEAMSQTYKRNQHGSHNPVKLGQMLASRTGVEPVSPP
jgi:ParB-like chromosome segregation protein Spo0J